MPLSPGSSPVKGCPGSPGGGARAPASRWPWLVAPAAWPTSRGPHRSCAASGSAGHRASVEAGVSNGAASASAVVLEDAALRRRPTAGPTAKRPGKSRLALGARGGRGHAWRGGHGLAPCPGIGRSFAQRQREEFRSFLPCRAERWPQRELDPEAWGRSTPGRPGRQNGPSDSSTSAPRRLFLSAAAALGLARVRVSSTADAFAFRTALTISGLANAGDPDWKGGAGILRGPTAELRRSLGR